MAYFQGLQRWNCVSRNAHIWLKNSPNFTRQLTAQQARANTTFKMWKTISLFVAIPIVSCLAWKKHEEDSGSEESRLSSLWRHYLMDDPVKREKERDEHLALMQKRKEEYLAKKKMPESPVQPLDLMSEYKATPINPVDGIQNST